MCVHEFQAVVLLCFCSGIIPWGQKTSCQGKDVGMSTEENASGTFYHFIEQWIPDLGFSQDYKLFFKSELL